MKLYHIILLLVLVVPAVSGATIKGNIYDMSLESVTNARVDIDTTPKQRYISKDGLYMFDVSPGNYSIKARQFLNNEFIAEVKESVLVDTADGQYIVDLILFPNTNVETIPLNETIINFADDYFTDDFSSYQWITITMLIIIAGVASYIIWNKAKGPNQVFIETEHQNQGNNKRLIEEKQIPIVSEINRDTISTIIEIVPVDSIDEAATHADAEQIIEFIRGQNGRTTQKDIRKHFPSSEAKISLIITELEHKKIIQKIKKGRGNIILLNERSKNKEEE